MHPRFEASSLMMKLDETSDFIFFHPATPYTHPTFFIKRAESRSRCRRSRSRVGEESAPTVDFSCVFEPQQIPVRSTFSPHVCHAPWRGVGSSFGRGPSVRARGRI